MVNNVVKEFNRLRSRYGLIAKVLIVLEEEGLRLERVEFEDYYNENDTLDDISYGFYETVRRFAEGEDFYKRGVYDKGNN